MSIANSAFKLGDKLLKINGPSLIAPFHTSSTI